MAEAELGIIVVPSPKQVLDLLQEAECEYTAQTAAVEGQDSLGTAVVR